MTQSPFLLQNLSAGHEFVVEYEPQNGIPIDGSNRSLRTYSPFVIRIIPPSILGEGNENVLVNQPVPVTGPVRESNRDRVSYATAIRGVATQPASTSSYDQMVNLGSAIPGLSSTSVSTIQARYNSARFTQVFGETVRSATGQGSSVITPYLANDITALSVLLQIKAMASTPPLLMLINPMSMTTQYAKVAQHQERSRMGFIYQAWGEELVKLSFTFKTGAYITGGGGSRSPSGVQRASRRDSASFQQLMMVLTLFKNGAYVHDVTYGSMAYPMVGNLAIEYDGKVYVGHPDTFSFSESEEQQNGGVEFEMEFTAIRVFDVGRPNPVIQPMRSPTDPYTAGRSRGTISRSGTQSGAQFFTAPVVGGDQSPPQPWSNTAVTNDGVVPSIVTSRRR